MIPSRSVALIADDHELFKAGLAAVLRDELGFDEVVDVDTLDEAIEQLHRHPEISLATFDISMSGVMNVASLQIVRQEFPTLQLAVVSGSDSREDILKALSIGLNGYVPKTMSIDDVVSALRVIKSGQIYVPPLMVKPEPAISSPPVSYPHPPEIADPAQLTPRQRQVLEFIAQGKSNKEIARVLNLSDGTVKVHVNALFRTLGVHNRVSAAAALNTFSKP